MASSSTQPGAASKKSILEPVMILEGHELSARKPPGRTFHNLCISYFSDGKQMISGSEDQTVRRWDLQAGKEIEGVREVCEEGVHAVGVSRDGRWIVAAGGDDKERGELKVWEVRTGIIRTFEGHSQSIICIDISADSTLLASGGNYPNVTTRVWNLNTGKLLFEIPAEVGAVRFSQDSKKLTVISNVARCIEVWDVETYRLDIRLVWTQTRKYSRGIVTRAPVIWTAKDQTILAAFNFKDDSEDYARTEGQWHWDYDEPKTIYEFDASTLQTVRAPFEGHTNIIGGLALSFDGALLASASRDRTIKLWAFESRQLLASFDVRTTPDHLIFSPNSYQLAYTTWSDKIYICDTPPHILATIQSAQEAQPNINAATNPRLLDSNATHRPVRRNPIQPLIVPHPQRDFSTIYPQERRAFLYYLRKILPFRMSPVRTDQLRDPLDFPANLPLPHKISPSVRATNQVHSDIDPHKNARSIPLGTQSSATAPTTFKTRLHHILTWLSARVGRALPPIVDVPLAPGRLRYAAADAPTFDEDLIRDEDYIPSTHQNSQQPSTGVQVTTGQHGSGRLCGCF